MTPRGNYHSCGINNEDTIGEVGYNSPTKLVHALVLDHLLQSCLCVTNFVSSRHAANDRGSFDIL